MSRFQLRFFCIYLILFGALQNKLQAQDGTIDSLKLLLKTAKHDTTRCILLGQLIEAEGENNDLWYKYNDELLAIAEKHKTEKGKLRIFYLEQFGCALNDKGYFAKEQGDFTQALEFYNKSLNTYKEAGFKDGVGTSLNNIALIYHTFGNISKALEYYVASLKIREEMKDDQGIATSLNNLGVIYRSQGDMAKAVECFERSLALEEKLNLKREMISPLNNLGYQFSLGKEYKKALEYYLRCVKISEEIGFRSGIANSLMNCGAVYSKIEENKKAMDCYTKSLSLREKLKDKKGITMALINLANLQFKLGNKKEGLKNARKGLNLSMEIGTPDNTQRAASSLKDMYMILKDHKNALEMFELEIKMRDSLYNESTRKASIKSQLKYEYEKQAAADSVAHAKESEIKNVELKRQSAEIRAKKNQQYALFGGLGLVIIFAGFMFNRFKVTQKQKLVIEHQKEIVEEQKKLVEEKQKEILDSIHYAKRIQMAQIPTEKQVAKNLERLQKK